MIQDMLYRFNGQDWSSGIRSIHSNMEVNHHTFTCNNNSVAFSVFDSDNQNEKEEYLIVMYRLTCGPIRFICESKQRHFNPSLEDSIITQEELYSVEPLRAIDIANEHVMMEYNDNISVTITYKPFHLTIFDQTSSIKLLTINSNSMLSIKKNSFDISFYSNNENPVRLIGLPARDSHVFLKPTIESSDERPNNDIKSEPYRIFNCDTGGFRPPKEYSVYGAINFLQSENSALFYSNSSDTFVDLIKRTSGSEKDRVDAHFLSNSGPLDIFLYIGNRLSTTAQFVKMTGPTFFPSISNFGFGHSKWGIKDEEEVESIMKLYDDSNIYFDTFWLDIDHLDSNMPFTVNAHNFPHYNELIEKLQSNGLHRNVAIIEDPHLPYDKGHEISDDCLKKGLEVKTRDNKTFVGVCWPGDSIYPDFLNEECRAWWGTKVPLNVNQWNDMNEPSVFNSLENTMPRDNIHKCRHDKLNDRRIELLRKSSIEKLEQVYSQACNSCTYNDKENTINDDHNKDVYYSSVHHQDVHNVYGHYHCLSTFNGVKERTRKKGSEKEDSKRPFVLTRSYFAGTSRHAAVWTGDQPSTLNDLQTSLHQICTASLCGMPYLGADIGGFFGNPSENLLDLWFVNSVWFYPFLRLHGEIQTKDRQQLVASSDLIKLALNERYLFVPYWYTMFYQLHINKKYDKSEANLAVRFAFVDFPDVFGVYDHNYSCCEHSFVGDSLLVSPVYKYDSNSNSEEFEFGNQKVETFVNDRYFNLRKILGNIMNQNNNILSSLNIDSALNKKLLPLFIKKGKIVPIFTTPAKSIALCKNGKVSLIVAVDQNNKADGCLFLDDGDTFNFESGDFAYRRFSFNNGKIQNASLCENQPNVELNDYLVHAEIGTFIIIQDNEHVIIKNDFNLKVVDDWEIDLL